MGTLEDLTDALARDVIAAMDEIGDDRFFEKVSKLLLDMSPTTQEAYMTAIRVRLAERRARKYVEDALHAARAAKAKAPE
ncbi:hypothetical protein [Rhodobacter ferrooxidans]|uniref:Uncharacterized protein n=1 Tax=Rhodobacter ferrooxidans TaxID=371731 RepID=C8RXV9_9RHOB|nr:hypothetical protein [Rhodobacter sp. SW2]EEW26357.1 conserved hypothetical protein [Rhodobacter sp. SW2]